MAGQDTQVSGQYLGQDYAPRQGTNGHRAGAFRNGRETVPVYQSQDNLGVGTQFGAGRPAKSRYVTYRRPQLLRQASDNSDNGPRPSLGDFPSNGSYNDATRSKPSLHSRTSSHVHSEVHQQAQNIDAVATLRGRVKVETKQRWKIGTWIVGIAAAAGALTGIGLTKAALLAAAFTLVGGPVGAVIGGAIFVGGAIIYGLLCHGAASGLGNWRGKKAANAITPSSPLVKQEEDRIIDTTLHDGDLPEGYQGAIDDVWESLENRFPRNVLSRHQAAIEDALQEHVSAQLRYFKSNYDADAATKSLQTFGESLVIHLMDLEGVASGHRAGGKEVKTVSDRSVVRSFKSLLEVLSNKRASPQEIAKARTKALMKWNLSHAAAKLGKQPACGTIGDCMQKAMASHERPPSTLSLAKGSPLAAVVSSTSKLQKSSEPHNAPINFTGTSCEQGREILGHAIHQLAGAQSRELSLQRRELEDSAKATDKNTSDSSEISILAEYARLDGLLAAMHIMEKSHPAEQNFQF